MSSSATNNETMDTVNRLVAVMKIDFPAGFNKSFSNGDSETFLKRRLYKSFLNIKPACVFDGYQECINRNPSFLPTTPELLSEVKKQSKISLKKIEEDLEAQKLAALPPPTITCNPLNLLAKAKAGTKSKTMSTAERLKLKEELRLKLNATVGHIGRQYADGTHLCAVPGCKKAGSMSDSVSGSNSWYCARHFIQKH